MAVSSEAIFSLLRAGSFDEAITTLRASPELWTQREAEGGHSVLHWAALFGNLELAQEALYFGLEVDARSENLQTPLMWAATRGQLKVAKVLLEAKADPHAQDSVGASPFILAVQHSQIGVLLLLFALCKHSELFASKDCKGCGALHWAAYKGDEPSLQLLEYFSADFHAVDNEQMTLLHRAAQGHQDRIIPFLLERGVDPSAVDNQGRTCLEVAQQVSAKSATARRLARLLEKRSSDVEAGTRRLVLRPGAEEMERVIHSAKMWVPALFWLCCVSIASLEFLIDLSTSAATLLPSTAMAFQAGVPLCLLVFAAIAFSDPGKAPARVKGNSAVEELLRALQKPGYEQVPDCSRLCTATFVLKDLRTKYCKQTKACVLEFDHFCGWLNVAIGRGNHRLFVLLSFLELSVQWLHLALCIAFARGAVVGSSWTGWLYNLAMQFPLLVFVLLMHGFSSPGILFLLVNHLYLIAINMTTNEMMNKDRYQHFWQEVNQEKGVIRKVFRNPFDKGSTLKNCLDFWWYRRRSAMNLGLREMEL